MDTPNHCRSVPTVVTKNLDLAIPPNRHRHRFGKLNGRVGGRQLAGYFLESEHLRMSQLPSFRVLGSPIVNLPRCIDSLVLEIQRHHHAFIRFLMQKPNAPDLVRAALAKVFLEMFGRVVIIGCTTQQRDERQ